MRGIKSTMYAGALLVAVSANTASASSMQSCLDEADRNYQQQMDRCQTISRNQFSVWNDRVDSDWCMYGAGQEHWANVNSCYSSYPSGVSFFKMNDHFSLSGNAA